jgi:hypothetical protein
VFLSRFQLAIKSNNLQLVPLLLVAAAFQPYKQAIQEDYVNFYDERKFNKTDHPKIE